MFFYCAEETKAGKINRNEKNKALSLCWPTADENEF